jgi:hypothetical protein
MLATLHRFLRWLLARRAPLRLPREWAPPPGPPPPKPEPQPDLSRFRASVYPGEPPFVVVFRVDDGEHWTLPFDRATWRLRDWPDAVPADLREPLEDALTLAMTREEGIRA